MQDDKNKQANESNPSGKKDNSTDEKTPALSIVDEAKKVRDEIKAENDRREKILKHEQQLHTEQLLGGSSGGHIQTLILSPEEQKVKDAADYFKGTALGDAIEKANEKK